MTPEPEDFRWQDFRWTTDPATDEQVAMNHRVITWLHDSARAYKSVWEYLTHIRGFTPETLVEFGIGFYPATFQIPGTFVQEGSEAHRSPLTMRITIPIYDADGVPISIVGRRLEVDKTKFKFLSLPYKKSKHVWNMGRAAEEVVRKDCVFLMEGFFDVMTLWQNGIRNAVCVQGGNISRTQMAKIRRYTANVLYIPDNNEPDKMGKRAGDEALARIQKAMTRIANDGFTFEHIRVPEGFSDINDVMAKGTAKEAEDFFRLLRSSLGEEGINP